MRFRHARNENTGLTMYDQSYRTMSGIAVGTGFDETRFKALAAALYGKAWGKMNAGQRLVISLDPSYVSNFLRDYMKEVQITRQPLTRNATDMVAWTNKFATFGYPRDIAQILLEEFYALRQNQPAMVPNNIWLPPPKSLLLSPLRDLSTTAKVGIGVGAVAALGIAAFGAYMVLKKD